MILLMTTAQPSNSPWGTANKELPLGLAYIGAVLEKEGFEVEIFDNYLLNKPIDYVKLKIERLAPEIVGITCSSNTYQRCVETAKAIKEVLPSCKVVVGGPHPSIMPESMLQHPEIDYVVLGEGELAIVQIANNIMKSKEDSVLAQIPSIAYRHEGKIVKNPQKFIDDLDQIPYPARHLMPMHLYDRKIKFLGVSPVDYVNVIRGCPYSCTWCNVKDLWGKTCRAFGPRRVVEELNHLINNFGTKGIYFVGDNFTIHKERTIEICKMIKEYKLDLEWVCDTGVDLISRELLKEMKVAGCRTVWFGVESGSPSVLEKINRNISPQQVIRAFKLCKEEEIQTAVSFMLGIPGETVKDMKTTFKFAKKLDPDWCQFNIFIAYPGCDLYEEILQKGLYDRMEDFLAYVKTEDFNFDSLLKIQRKFHQDFNRSPKRVLRKIRKEGILRVLKNGIKLLQSNGNVNIK